MEKLINLGFTEGWGEVAEIIPARKGDMIAIKTGESWIEVYPIAYKLYVKIPSLIELLPVVAYNEGDSYEVRYAPLDITYPSPKKEIQYVFANYRDYINLCNLMEVPVKQFKDYIIGLTKLEVGLPEIKLK